MALGEARPGYELWRPNQEKAQSVTTKWTVVLLLLISAGVAGIITVGGWTLLTGGAGMGIVCGIYVAMYVVFAFFVARWARGVLPVAAAFAMLLLIFAAVGAGSWFARDKTGFDDALLPVPLIGLLVLILIPLQVLVIAVGMIAFNQEWHIEEERKIGSSENYGAGGDSPAGREESAPQPA